MILFSIFALGLFIYYIIRLLIHPEENHHSLSGRYYDAFPNAPIEERKPPRKRRQNEILKQQEELNRKVNEYDKNHFFDYVNKRWVKQTADGTYVSSCSFRDWNMGLRDDWGEVEVGKLVTHQEYFRRQKYYDNYDPDMDEDYDPDMDDDME